jgi:hypothetical protein
MNPTTQQINLELGEKEAEGIYANFAVISHSPAEFVMDFTRILPGIPKTKVYARLIMAPQHAKSFARALHDNIEKYEKQYGEITLLGKDQNKPFGFQQGNSPPGSPSEQ